MTNGNDQPKESLINTLRSVLSAVPIAVCMKDLNLRYVSCSHAFEKLHGLSKSDLIGKTSTEIFGEAGEIDLSTDHNALFSEEDLKYETVIVNAELELREFAVTKTKIRDPENGSVIGLLSSFEDRTQLNSVERSLLRSRVAIESSRDSFLLIDRNNFDTVDCNQHATKILGYDRETLLKLKPEAFMPQVSELRLGEFFDSSKVKGVETLETLIMRSDGSVFESELQINPVHSEFEELFVLIIRDVSERKYAEIALKQANKTLRLIGSINKILISSESESELMKRICQRVAEPDSFAAVFALVSPSNGIGEPAIYQSANSALVLSDCLAEMGIKGEELKKILKVDFTEPITRKAEPRTEVAVGRLPTWVIPTHSSCLCISNQDLDNSRVGLVIFANKSTTFDDNSIELLQELLLEIVYGIRGLQVKKAKQIAEEQIANQLAIESSISKFSSCLLKSHSLYSGIQNALPNFLEATGADQVFLYEFRTEAEAATIADRLCQFEKSGATDSTHIPESIDLQAVLPRWYKRLQQHENIDTKELKPTKEERSALELSKDSRLIIFPIHTKNEWIGFLGANMAKQVKDEFQVKKEMLSIATNLLAEQYARHRSNEHLKILASAINTSDEGVIICTADSSFAESRIIFANDGLCRISGYTKEFIINKNPTFIQTKELEPQAKIEMKSALDSGKSYKCEIIAKRRDGSHFNCDRRIYPIASDEGCISNYVCILQDITEQKELESRLSFANKLESIGQLSAGIAHEINTPSQFIGDNLSFLNDAWEKLDPLVACLLKSEVLDQLQSIQEFDPPINAKRLSRLIANIPEAISDANEGVERISTIVKAMREFSHPERRMVPTNLNKCISTTVTVARNEWKYISELTMELDENLPTVDCMPGDINQVILNLIVNSAQAIQEKIGDSPERGKIEIKTKAREDFACISITDTGGGIPDEISKMIFDPFFTTKEVGKGTGQGLFMAHTIIEQNHNGRLWFATERGQGTTFHIELPITHNLPSRHEKN